MTVPAKPANYTINTGATYYPDYLWIFDEDESATYFPNQGSAGSANLNHVGFDRSVDGTHGVIWSSLAANSDYAQIESNLGLTTGATMIFLCNVTLNGTTAATGSTIGGFFQSGVNNYMSVCALGDTLSADPGRPRGYVQDGTNTDASAGTAANRGGAFNFFVMTLTEGSTYGLRAEDDTLSNPGSMLTVDVSTFNRFALSMRRDSTPNLPTTVDWLAAAVFSNTVLTDAQLDAIYADPWGELGVEEVTATNVAAGAGAITVQGQIPITYIPPRRMTLDVIIR